MKEAAQMLIGRHDFRSFMSINDDKHVGFNSSKYNTFELYSI